MKQERNQKPSITVSVCSQAKSSTGVATNSINSNKTKGVTKISTNLKNTFRANTSVNDDDSGSQDCQEEATDMRNGKRKHILITNFNTNKKSTQRER